jgi:hypothetical protein
MSSANNPSALFPDLTREKKAISVNNDKGEFVSSWSLFLSQLVDALQGNLKNEGFLLPPLNTDQIAYIESLYAPYIGDELPRTLPDISGQTIFDSDARVPKVFIITFDGGDPPLILTAAWKTYTLT